MWSVVIPGDKCLEAWEFVSVKVVEVVPFLYLAVGLWVFDSAQDVPDTHCFAVLLESCFPWCSIVVWLVRVELASVVRDRFAYRSDVLVRFVCLIDADLWSVLGFVPVNVDSGKAVVTLVAHPGLSSALLVFVRCCHVLIKKELMYLVMSKLKSFVLS